MHSKLRLWQAKNDRASNACLNKLPKLLLLSNKLIAKVFQITGHGGIKHDDLTWNDPAVHICM